MTDKTEQNSSNDPKFSDTLMFYGEFVKTTAIFPEKKALEYLGMGLSSEVGELLGHFKKFIRDGNWDHKAIVKEMGDVMWYWSSLCNHIKVDPRRVLDENMQKLRDRSRRGVIGGSGDDR